MEALGLVLKVLAAIPVIMCTTHYGVPSTSVSKQALDSVPKDQPVWFTALVISSAAYLALHPIIAEGLKWMAAKFNRQTPKVPWGIVGATIYDGFQLVSDPKSKLGQVAGAVGSGVLNALIDLSGDKNAQIHVEIFKLEPLQDGSYKVGSRLYDSVRPSHAYEHMFRSDHPLDHLIQSFTCGSGAGEPDELPVRTICPDGEYEYTFRSKGFLQREKKYHWAAVNGSFLFSIVAANLVEMDSQGNVIQGVGRPFALITARAEKFVLNNDMDSACDKMFEIIALPLVQQFVLESTS